MPTQGQRWLDWMRFAHSRRRSCTRSQSIRSHQISLVEIRQRGESLLRQICSCNKLLPSRARWSAHKHPRKVSRRFSTPRTWSEYDNQGLRQPWSVPRGKSCRIFPVWFWHGFWRRRMCHPRFVNACNYHDEVREALPTSWTGRCWYWNNLRVGSPWELLYQWTGTLRGEHLLGCWWSNPKTLYGLACHFEGHVW